MESIDHDEELESGVIHVIPNQARDRIATGSFAVVNCNLEPSFNKFAASLVPLLIN
jgi:hypothetical protein